MALIAIWIRWLAVGEPVEHNRPAHVAFQFAFERVMPYYWAANAIGLLILILFGRSVDALLAWLLYFLALMFGYFFLQPSFYA